MGSGDNRTRGTSRHAGSFGCISDGGVDILEFPGHRIDQLEEGGDRCWIVERARDLPVGQHAGGRLLSATGEHDDAVPVLPGTLREHAAQLAPSDDADRASGSE